MSNRPIVVAITGASGAPYAFGVLESLIAAERSAQLIVSSHGLRLLSTEMGIGTVAELRDRLGASAFDTFVTVYDDNDRGAAPASGSA